VACGTWPTRLPEGTRADHIGNPVRAAVMARAGAVYTPPGDWPLSLVIIGGSQGARILSEIVPNAVAKLPKGILARLRVAQQARPEDIDRVIRAYDYLGVTAEVQPFSMISPAGSRRRNWSSAAQARPRLRIFRSLGGPRFSSPLPPPPQIIKPPMLALW